MRRGLNICENFLDAGLLFQCQPSQGVQRTFFSLLVSYRPLASTGGKAAKSVLYKRGCVVVLQQVVGLYRATSPLHLCYCPRRVAHKAELRISQHSCTNRTNGQTHRMRPLVADSACCSLRAADADECMRSRVSRPAAARTHHDTPCVRRRRGGAILRRPATGARDER